MAAAIFTDQALRGVRVAAMAALLGAGLTACASHPTLSPLADIRGGGVLHGTDKPYQVNGQWYYPKADPHYDEVGLASWYGYPLRNRRTADGEVFDQNLISAAHKTLPLPCIVEVTNLENGRRVRVRVNDRGPFVDGRVIDLSKGAAEQLGFAQKGVTRVRVRYVSAAPALAAPGLMQASYGDSASHYNAGPSYAPPPPRSAMDNYDSVERADPQGHISPVAAPIDRDPSPIADWYSNGPMVASASPALNDPAPIAAPIAAPPAVQVSRGGFAVQAGAYASRPAADRAVEQLTATGPAYVQPIQRNGATLYRVTVGAYPDAAAAAQARERVIASGFSDARVIASF